MVESYWQSLEAVYSGDLPLPAFEQWVYGTADLEPAIGATYYLELISFDFRQEYALHELRKLIGRIYDERRPGQLDYDTAKRVARDFLAGQRDLWSTARELTRLWHEGHENWIPSEVVYIDSELDSYPSPAVRPLWDSGALTRLLSRQKPLLQEYERVLREAAEVVLVRLAERGLRPNER
jgi:hypothetical protein